MKPVHCTYLGFEEPAVSDWFHRIKSVAGGRSVYAQMTSEQFNNKALRRVCLEEFGAFRVKALGSCKKCGRIEQTPTHNTCDGCGAPK